MGEVRGHLGGEVIEGHAPKFGEGRGGDDDVGGVVDDGAVGGCAEREAVAVGGGGFQGRVGFDEESIGGDGAEMGEARGGEEGDEQAWGGRAGGENRVGMKRRGAGGRSGAEGEGRANPAGPGRGLRGGRKRARWRVS